MTDTVSQSEFPVLLHAAGLHVSPDEQTRLYAGYLGLQTLLARLPADPGLTDEPAFAATLTPDPA